MNSRPKTTPSTAKDNETPALGGDQPGRTSEPSSSRDTRQPGVWAALLLVLAIAAGAVGYVAGANTGSSVEAAAQEGRDAGTRAGTSAGKARGRQLGLRQGQKVGYKPAYKKAYDAAFERALNGN